MKDRSREQEPLGPIDVTAGPRKSGGEGGGEEVDTPSNDHVVVVRDQHSVEQVGKPDALEEGDTAEERIFNVQKCFHPTWRKRELFPWQSIGPWCSL